MNGRRDQEEKAICVCVFSMSTEVITNAVCCFLATSLEISGISAKYYLVAVSC